MTHRSSVQAAHARELRRWIDQPNHLWEMSMKKKTAKKLMDRLVKAVTKPANVIDALNDRELTVVFYLVRAEKQDGGEGTRGARGLHDIAIQCFDRKRGKGAKASSYFRANSWARNAVRRPLRDRIIARVGKPGSGMYRLTSLGARLVQERAS